MTALKYSYQNRTFNKLIIKAGKVIDFFLTQLN